MRDYPLPLPRALLEGLPTGKALLRGDDSHPDLWGEVLFYPWQEGALILTRVLGLPRDGLWGLQIHALGNCATGGDVPFFCAGPVFELPGLCRAPPAGLLPPLLSTGGKAFSLGYSDRFQPEQVLGRTVVLHPPVSAGDSPEGRVACGLIQPL